MSLCELIIIVLLRMMIWKRKRHTHIYISMDMDDEKDEYESVPIVKVGMKILDLEGFTAYAPFCCVK